MHTNSPYSIVSFIFFYFLVSCFTVFAKCQSDQITLGAHATIAFEGDSLTYGFDRTSSGTRPPINGSNFLRNTAPFPESVGRLVKGTEVWNRGYPGDRTTEGLERWKNEGTPALTVVMYGTNDYANYGGYKDGKLRPEDFMVNLSRILDRRLSAGGQVLLLTPPPIQDVAVDRGLDEYREIVRSVGTRRGVQTLDTPPLLKTITDKWTDGVHLSTSSNNLIAAGIASLICVRQQE